MINQENYHFPFSVSVPPRHRLATLPTLLRPLDRLRGLVGGPRIWLKCDDQTGSGLSGNKVRKLEFVIGEALEQGVDTLVTCGGLQSNHCRATALAGAQLGLEVNLILRGNLPDSSYDGNLLLDQLAGAYCDIHEPNIYQERLSDLLDKKKRELEARGKRVRVIPTGASDATGLWGYLSAASELQADFSRHQITPSTIICATGSAGTQAGLSLGFHFLQPRVKVLGIAVCDDKEYFFRRIRADVCNWYRRYADCVTDLDIERRLAQLTLYVSDDYIGPGYGLGYPELFDTISLLARTEGVILDPVYTGKAFYGMLQEIKKGRFNESDDIVFIHTGGTFGLFPYREHLSQMTIDRE